MVDDVVQARDDVVHARDDETLFFFNIDKKQSYQSNESLGQDY